MHEEQSVLGDVGHRQARCTPWPLGGQTSDIHGHQQSQTTAKWAGSSHTVIVGAQDCSSSLSKVCVGCTLLFQYPWWLWDRGAQSPLLTGHSGTGTYWAGIVSSRLNLLPFLPFYPFHCTTRKSVPGNIARMMTLEPRDDIRIQGCLNNLLSAVTSCSKTVPTFRSLCFHQAGPCPVNMPGLDGSSASASPSQRDSGCCYLPSSCHVPAILRNSFELVDFGWELNHLLGCILSRGKWLCHLCPAFWLCHCSSRKHYKLCTDTQTRLQHRTHSLG